MNHLTIGKCKQGNLNEIYLFLIWNGREMVRLCKNGFYENKFLLAFKCQGEHGYMHLCAYVYVHTYLLSTT